VYLLTTSFLKAAKVIMTDSKRSLKDYLPILMILGFFVVVQAIALFLSDFMVGSELEVFEDPTQISNSAVYTGLVLISVILILILIKFGFKWIFKFLVYFSTLLTLYITFAVLFTFIPFLTAAGYDIASLVVATILTVLLYIYPEWYIVDFTGILSAGGIAALFGISFSIVPALVLLVLLAIYDAISVYKTKHMLTMVNANMDKRLPLMLIAPKNLNYSFIKTGFKKGGGNEAYFLGVGDFVEPTILVVSAHVFLDSVYPVIGATLGTLVGCMVLFSPVLKGKVQAGLPFLNTGAILGFFVGVLLSGTWIF
jgi:presenilin-like A22 family membrane protease